MRSCGSPAQCLIERLDANHRELVVLLDRRLRHDGVPVVGDRRIVDLQDDAGIDDRLVFLVQRVGAGEHELFVGLVMEIADARRAARPDRAHESFHNAVGGQRGLEVRDVGLDGGVSLVLHWAGADRVRRPSADRSRWDGRDRYRRAGILRGRAAPSDRPARARPPAPCAAARSGVPPAANFDAVEAMENVAEPGPIVDVLAHRLAEFAVVWNGNADVALSLHDVRDG